MCHVILCNILSATFLCHEIRLNYYIKASEVWTYFSQCLHLRARNGASNTIDIVRRLIVLCHKIMVYLLNGQCHWSGLIYHWTCTATHFSNQWATYFSGHIYTSDHIYQWAHIPVTTVYVIDWKHKGAQILYLIWRDLAFASCTCNMYEVLILQKVLQIKNNRIAKWVRLLWPQ